MIYTPGAPAALAGVRSIPALIYIPMTPPILYLVSMINCDAMPTHRMRIVVGMAMVMNMKVRKAAMYAIIAH